MNDIAIRCENLSKRYRIGQRERYQALRDVLTEAFYAPFRHIARSGRRSARNGQGTRRTTGDWFWALDDVSLQIKRGEVVGVIGRNGAGKTTLLKILSRITKPTKGYAEIHGRVGSLLEVGTGFHPELTGRENVYLSGAILGMKKAEIDRKFDEIVAFADVERFLDMPVKHFSSGMFVRLAFAVAAHLEPEILLVDEVLAVGDAAFQKKCLGKMGQVASEGRAVLFVSHNLASVQALCERGVVLENGTVCHNATASVAIAEYLKSLEQAASQNLLDRTDRSGEGKVRLARVDISINGANASGTLATGRSARFVFHLNAILPSLTCLFTIYDHLGQSVAHFNSAVHSPEDVRDPNAEATFICHIDQMPLVPGQYRINVAILCDDQLQDHVEAAATFDVEAGTVHGRPVSRDTRYGSVFVHHRWILPH